MQYIYIYATIWYEHIFKKPSLTDTKCWKQGIAMDSNSDQLMASVEEKATIDLPPGLPASQERLADQ